MIHRVRYLAGAAVVASIAFSVACDEDEEPSGPNVVQTNYTVTLTGAAERPTAVTTNATGNATLTLFDDDSITYRVQVASIDSVFASHIHSGDANTDGPIMVFLGTSSPAASFTALTTLYQGTILPTSTFTAPATFADLLTRLNNSTAYVNVHTRRNPGGEIRGTIVRQ